jgi:hypothetical protein
MAANAAIGFFVSLLDLFIVFVLLASHLIPTGSPDKRI